MGLFNSPVSLASLQIILHFMGPEHWFLQPANCAQQVLRVITGATGKEEKQLSSEFPSVWV